MPNHFHLLVKQVQENGISRLLSKLSNSYTRYFNVKHQRIGPLFQGSFKAIRIESEEQLNHLSRYIHLNPLIDYLVKDLRNYPYSSYPEYLGLSDFNLCTRKAIIESFKSVKDYEKFVLDQEGYAREIKRMERLLLDVQ
jgi:putative transposase